MNSSKTNALYAGFGGPRPSPLQKALSERPLPVLDFEQPIGLTSHGAREEATSVLKTFNAALASDSIDDLEKCFFTPQAYWRDLLAYTDTFFTCLDYEKIAAKLTEIKRNRGFNDGFRVKEANFDGSCPDLVRSDLPLRRTKMADNFLQANHQRRFRIQNHTASCCFMQRKVFASSSQMP